MATLSILYKHYDEAAIAAIVPFFGFHVVFVSGHATKVYMILMMSAMLAAVGTSIEILVSLGTKVWLLNFVLSIWWLWYLDQNNLFSMSISFGACSLSFGASVVSLIHTLPLFNERDVLIFFGGASIMFMFNIFAFRTGNVASFFKVHYFNVPVSISCMVAMSYVLKNVAYPKLLFSIPACVVGIPGVWFICYLFFRYQIWEPGKWIPIHGHVLSVLYILTRYDVFVLLGIYMVMFCCVLNSKMHTYDIIFTLEALEGADFHPFPLVLSFYYEFFGRFSYLAISSGSYVCRYLWNSNEVYLMAQWEEICGLGARFSVYLKEIFLKVERYTYDFIMTWFVRAWCFCLPYVQQFKGYLLEFREYFGRILLMSVVFAFFSVNLFIFVSSRLAA